MLAANDYYPLGMLSRTIGNSAKYKFGFNGKENDNEVKGLGSQQDYGMRVYDPRIGRFLSVDPLTKGYPMLTPYQFASNRPIDGVDLDGKEWSKTETYNPETGVVNDHFQVKLNIQNESMTKNLPLKQLAEALAKDFKPAVNVYDDKRRVQYSGDIEITFGTQTIDGFGMRLTDDYMPFSKAKFTGTTTERNSQVNTSSIYANIYNNNSKQYVARSSEKISGTILHEMFHQASTMSHPQGPVNEAPDVDLVPLYLDYRKGLRLITDNDLVDPWNPPKRSNF